MAINTGCDFGWPCGSKIPVSNSCYANRNFFTLLETKKKINCNVKCIVSMVKLLTNEIVKIEALTRDIHVHGIFCQKGG